MGPFPTPLEDIKSMKYQREIEKCDDKVII